MSDFYGENESVEIPTTSNYMRWEENDNRFRILGAFSEKTAIQGLLYWKTIEGKRKPVRLPKNSDGTFPSVPVAELEVNKYSNLDMPKYFWCVPVYNYQEKRIQLLEISQKGILKGIQAYISNKKWGDPRDYDIIVNRGKEGEKTVYTVTVDPKEKLDSSIIDTYLSMNINIQALFSGDDPFIAKDDSEEIANQVQKGL